MPPRKRASAYGDSLTGGTGDVNPQWLSFKVTQSGADAITVLTLTLPVQRLPNGNRAMIMEILQIMMDFPLMTTVAAAVGAYNIRVNVCTSNPGTAGTPTFDDPHVIAMCQKENVNSFTAAGTLYQVNFEPQVINLDDGAGHGLLVATDNLFIQCSSVSTGVANVVSGKIKYRWKDVSLAEYIGIVQSQQ